MYSFFARLDEKHKLLGNFEKILKFFDENSLVNLNFLFLFSIFFENVLLKIELSEIAPSSYINIFGFGGRAEFSPSPWLGPWFGVLYIWSLWSVRITAALVWI